MPNLSRDLRDLHYIRSLGLIHGLLPGAGSWLLVEMGKDDGGFIPPLGFWGEPSPGGEEVREMIHLPYLLSRLCKDPREG